MTGAVTDPAPVIATGEEITTDSVRLPVPETVVFEETIGLGVTVAAPLIDAV